jgi:hypothetical protein
MKASAVPSDDTSSRTVARALTAAAAALLAIGLCDFGGVPEAEAKGGKGKFEYGCRVQSPQKFLERRAFMLPGGSLDVKKQAKAVRYLAEHYGHVSEETKVFNAKGALGQAKNMRFMGLPISVHAKIAPALTCVEKHLRKTGGRYKPRALGGFRAANTYRGLEVSNHLFGVALDIDPDRNPCCHCVDPWPSNPICKLPGPVYKRTALPKTWIKAFERYGFDWLGHDALEDTMHFEFLGDPERIKK